MEEDTQKILVIEPYYGGSHKKLIDVICKNLPSDVFKLITMSGKKWHWRARTSALYISTQIPENHRYEVLFCTSVLPLAELIGLRPDLTSLNKVVYFHENQLDFPVRVTKQRDFQYGFNEILTCLTADKVLFNSKHNMESFLTHVNKHVRMQPDYKTKHLDVRIRAKSSVIYFPLELDTMQEYFNSVVKQDSKVLYIVWPHRWEFDKNPEAFYRVLCRLDDNRYSFQLSILGTSFNEKPEAFNKLLNRFSTKICHNGYIENTTEYYNTLRSADVVVSTAIHEFFGVSVMEAVYAGCIPVVPNRLAYKELYGGKIEEIYGTEDELYDILEDLCIQKEKGNLSKNYTHLALPFESKKWFDTLMGVIGFNLADKE